MAGLVEGSYVVDVYGDIYAVKGVVHPPSRVYATPRVINNVKTKNLQQAFCFAVEKTPQYLYQDPYTGRTVIAIPETHIKQTLKPSKQVADGPAKLVEAAKNLSQILADAGLDFGFTGSLLLGTADENSDIDVVIYGGAQQYQAVKQLRLQQILKPVDEKALRHLTESRRDTLKALPTIQAEQRKILTGTFNGFLYTMKIVPTVFWEKWSDTRVSPQGPFEAVVEVVDDTYSFTTPAKYGVKIVGDGPELVEVISFRSRFSEVAVKGERLSVKGVLEKVVKPGHVYFRLNVGLEADDYMQVVL